EHYFDCVDCADEVRLGAVVREEVRAAGRQAPTEGTSGLHLVKPRPRNLVAVVMPWAAAAALALVAGYQALVVVPDLRALDSAQAISPVVLRQASRGDLTTVSVQDSGPFVTMTPDVDLRGVTGPIPWRLRRADGTEIVSSTAKAPAAGQPLMLLLPTRDVRRAGEYVLIVDTRGTPEEYHFKVAER